jgi:hypothetical protein
MDNGHLVRYSAPTKYDTAEYGKVWQQMLDDGSKAFIQVSKDEQNPHWVEMGKFLEKVFAHKLYDEDFVLECLNIYYS